MKHEPSTRNGPRRVVLGDARKQAGFATVLAWLLLLLVVAAFGVFLFTLYLPVQEQNHEFRNKLDEHAHKEIELQGSLGGVQEDNAGLTVKVAELEAKVAELEQQRAAAVADKDAAVVALEKAQSELSASLGAEIATGDVAIARRGDELVIDVDDKILFDSGAAELNTRGQSVLRQVAATMVGMPERVFQIGGHTDSAPLSAKIQERFPTNWELSTTRATNVVRFLEEQCQVPGKQLVAAGFAWHRPVASNRSTRGKRKNRRIEIVMLRGTLQG